MKRQLGILMRNLKLLVDHMKFSNMLSSKFLVYSRFIWSWADLIEVYQGVYLAS